MSEPYFERLAKAICFAEFSTDPGTNADEYWAGVAPENKEAYRQAASAAYEKLNASWPGAVPGEGQLMRG